MAARRAAAPLLAVLLLAAVSLPRAWAQDEAEDVTTQGSKLPRSMATNLVNGASSTVGVK